MGKRIFYVVIIVIILAGVFAKRYMQIEYGEELGSSVTLSQEELTWVKEHGKILYGADHSSPPLRYIDETNGQYTGFVVDYINALSIELGVDIEMQPVSSWNEAIKKLSDRESNFFDMIPSDNRRKIFDFSDTIYSLRGAILIPGNETNITGYQDLAGKTVVVPQGDYAIDFLESRVKDIKFVYARDMQEAIRTLIEKRADAVVGDEPVIIYYREKLGVKNDFKILDKIMYENNVSLAVPKSDRVLLSILNKGIQTLNRRDVMTKIQQKWFGITIQVSPEKTAQKISLLISIFTSALLLIFYLFYNWNNILKKEVEKRTEELNISRNNLQTTFDGLTHLMLVVDREYTISNVNESFCKSLKLEKNEILGRNIYDFENSFPDDLAFMIDDTFRDNSQNNMEYKNKGKIYEITTFPLKDEKSVLIMAQDITQLRISEQQLLQDRKMVAIGQLAAGVAHEIRNPLGIIRNYCYLIKNAKGAERIDQSVKVIEGSVQRASEIINNLLNFSRISCDRVELTDVKQFLSGILELEKEMLASKYVEVILNCPEEICVYLKQEPLKHIVANIISNACDAMPQGGHLTIDCFSRHQWLILSFTDTGCGIGEEDLDHIFNPFFTTKKPGKGVGLGLYIVFNEVQKCGGEIRVTSIPGKGTKFTIVLPVKGEKKNEAE